MELVRPVDVKRIDTEDTLSKARESYGNKNQILVCIEELNELACVLAKYNRYDDECVARKELHDKAVDELADVYIILEHVKSILNIPNEDVIIRASLKLRRLNRWLSNSDSMQETINDRAVEDNDKKECSSCLRNGLSKEGNTICNVCLSAEAYEGNKPYYKER